jgi:hypothetical protein
VQQQESQQKQPTQQQPQQQQQQQPQRVNGTGPIKIGSVKPPPPSTKIPKSAVIMPDGTTSSTTNVMLDVQFGIDIETPCKRIEVFF